MKTILSSIRLLIVFTVLTGVVYPLAVTGLSRVFFAQQADGSLMVADGRLTGSSLLAQKTESPRHFWPRPSAADYATVASGASNKGPTSADLVKAIAARREQFGAGAPTDLLTTSGSGLDPHISPVAAEFQAARVATSRGLPLDAVRALIQAHVEPPQWGVFGEPRVNVLALNLALDTLH